MITNSTTIYYHPTSYSARYTFSGKERDEESGFSYFGSRYYNSAYSIWMSVDPMSDKYPSLSPYAYCGNNPVIMHDPNGKDYEVVVDKVNKTITIKATYYTNPNNKDRVSQGVQSWNSQSGLYEYTTDGGETYSVNFNLKVVNRKTVNDIRESRGAWNWVATADLDDTKRGESDGVNIVIDNDNVKAPIRTVTHEIGHTLGIPDDDYGVMLSGGYSESILDEHIMTILDGVGIKATNGSSYNTDLYCSQHTGANRIGQYNMSGSFRRKN